MSITENNIKSISFFNNNIKKLDYEVNRTISILEELHEMLYGIYIKLDKDKYLNTILSNYKENIYNKIVNPKNNITPNYDFYYAELRALITQCHLDTYNDKINWYYKTQFPMIFNKLRIEKNNAEINKINEELLKEIREDINYDVNLKLENFEDNINYILNKKINDLKIDFEKENKKKIKISNYIYMLYMIIFIYNFSTFFYFLPSSS